jgi:hypothetical protein
MSIRQQVAGCREEEESRCHSEKERKAMLRHGGDNDKRSAQDRRNRVCSQESAILLFR